MLCQKNNTQHATILTKDIDNYNNKVYFTTMVANYALRIKETKNCVMYNEEGRY
nr:MAG TPA: hypothetical protein [Caudoviricetes sp.]